jgi:hypothetical protein
MARGNNSRGQGAHPNRSDFPFADLQMPPWGSYDPALLAQINQSQRGLLDQLKDIRIGNRQARQDKRLSTRLAKRTTRQNLGELRYQKTETKINFRQDLQDLAIAKQRGTQDYNIALNNLGRKYANLASSQSQSANAAGLSGGFAAASAAKRAANQAVERQPLDISQQRNLADIALKQQRDTGQFGRTMAHYGTLAQQQRQSLHTQLKGFRRSLHRTLRSSRLQKSRAIREQGFFGLDQTAQAFFAAHQAHPHIKFPSMGDIRKQNYNKQGRPGGGGGHP